MGYDEITYAIDVVDNIGKQNLIDKYGGTICHTNPFNFRTITEYEYYIPDRNTQISGLYKLYIVKKENRSVQEIVDDLNIQQ